MCALSVHSFFAGVATGLADSKSHFWNLLAGILLHKWAAAMTLGFQLAVAYEKIWQILWQLSIFMFSTPVGVLVGIALGDCSKMVSSSFNAIAAGTFVYVACTEVVP